MSVMKWVADVQGHIVRRWHVVISQGRPCGLRPRSPVSGQFEQCLAPAIGICGCCGAPVCLGHALIGQRADLLCTACLSDYVRIVSARANVARQAEPVDESMLRRAHLRTLGLRDGASWQAIHAAFRKKAARMHPDRAKPGKRAEAEAKFKALSAAYEWLRPRYERAA
jgi:hypothetical protein